MIYAEALAEQSTAGAPLEALRAQQPLLGATYEVRWYAEVYNDMADGLKIGTEITVTADGSVLGTTCVAADKYAAASGFARLAVKEAQQPVFAVTTAPVTSGTAFIRNVRLSVSAP